MESPKIDIEGRKFDIIGEIEYITLADSFVLKNKMGKGHGEARLYVGPQNDETRKFFSSFKSECFFLKKDFQQYLKDAEQEYKIQEQGYNKDISGDLQDYVKEADSFNKEILFFRIESANGKQDPHRYYIRSEDKIYEFMRRVALPQISYMSILKLRSNDQKVFYYFRIFLDYYGSIDHPSIVEQQEKKIESDSKIKDDQKTELRQARVGQGIYRDKLLKECPMCPFTLVTDERVLVASHIKPWVISDNVERMDSKNGFIFTPTYDRLFDRGFISFEDEGKLLISPWLSPLTQRRLNLSPNKKYDLNMEGKKEYLDYHRENIFKK